MKGYSMKIESNMSALNAMNSENAKKDKTLQKIASGIESGMEDASLRTIATMLQTQISTMSQGLSNANEGVAMMQIADGALSNLSQQTQTLNDLSVRYNSASLNETQKQALTQEFNRTTEAMGQTLQSATYNGQSLFGQNLSFSLGTDSMSVTLGSVSPQGLSISDSESISRYAQQITDIQSNVGSAMNGFVSASNSILEQITATAAAKSQMADTDMAKAIRDYQQNTTLMNSAQLAMAHQNTLLQQSVGRLLG